MKTIEQLREELKNAEILVQSINDDIYNHPWYFEKLIKFYKDYDFIVDFINQFEYIKFKDEGCNEDYTQIFEFKLKNDYDSRYLFTFCDGDGYFSTYKIDRFMYLENMSRHIHYRYKNYIYPLCEPFSKELLQKIYNEEIINAIVLLCLIERTN